MADACQIRRGVCGKGKRGLLFLFALSFGAEVLACARDGEALFIQKLLNFQNTLYVPPPIHSLPRVALGRSQQGKFRFPEPQDVRR